MKDQQFCEATALVTLVWHDGMQVPSAVWLVATQHIFLIHVTQLMQN